MVHPKTRPNLLRAAALCVATFVLFWNVQRAGAESATEQKAYRRGAVQKSRLGGPQAALLSQARSLKDRINATVLGQERAADILQAIVTQYAKGIGTRKRDPVGLHLIGLPALGKSEILDQLEQHLGIPTARLDMHRYLRSEVVGSGSFSTDLRKVVSAARQATPRLLVLDELDKLDEKNKGPSDTMGAVNQLLSSGTVQLFDGRHNGQDALIVSAMNLSEAKIETYIKKALGAEKSYWALSVDDFQKLHRWMISDAGSYEVLGDIFRTNTTTRIGPNAIFLKPLDHEDYAKLVQLKTRETIEGIAARQKGSERLQVTHSDTLLKTLQDVSVYAPAGARATVTQVPRLVEQLVNIGALALREGDPQDPSFGQPREVHLEWRAKEQKAVVTITPLAGAGKRTQRHQPFQVEVAYNPDTKNFLEPDTLARVASASDKVAERREVVTKAAVRALRFPKVADAAKGLAKTLDRSLYGLSALTKEMQERMAVYLASENPVTGGKSTAAEPMILAGFPGIGKSDLALRTAKALGLGVAMINLQEFTGNDKGASASLAKALSERVEAARKVHPGGKYILLVEELDKVPEINPDSGKLLTPLPSSLAVIKELLNSARYTAAGNGDKAGQELALDLRDAFPIYTMNFATDRFKFEADPRLTSIDDVTKAHRQLASSKKTIREVLGTLFLPDTASRMMDGMHVVKPLQAADYSKLIDREAAQSVADRFGGRAAEVGKIELKMTPEYRHYLEAEVIVPSEGARNTAKATRRLVSRDLAAAMNALPRSGANGRKFATAPLTVTLHFRPGRSEVVYRARLQQEASHADVKLGSEKVARYFPPPRAYGKMPMARLSTAGHELGHALARVRLGGRFLHIAAISPGGNVNGYVRTQGEVRSPADLITHIYSGLASRAMERILKSNDPLSANAALSIGTGVGQDNDTVIAMLYDLVHRLNFDPEGGTGTLVSDSKPKPVLKPKMIQQLQKVLRDMELYLVRDFLSAHPMAWYKEKIRKVARAGVMDEITFYETIGYRYPGDNAMPYGERSRLATLFAEDVQREPAAVQRARAFQMGTHPSEPKRTAEQNLEAAIAFFKTSLHKHLHSKAEN